MTKALKEDFLRNPIGDLGVEKFPISKPGDLIKSFKAKGIDKVETLFAQFLLFERNKALFTTWIKEMFDATDKQAEQANELISEWCKHHFDKK